MLKICSLCSKELPLSAFYRDTRVTSGYYSQCKPCHQSTIKKSRKTVPEKRNIDNTVRLYTLMEDDTKALAAKVYASRKALGLPVLPVEELRALLGLTPTK